MDNIKNTNLIPPSPQIDINSLKPFTRFCCSIGAIPSSYLVSMSYEEQLLWLCDYLQNTVIPTVNNNGQAVAELQGLYVQLKNYVDNYFTNLDVQEEINNKLDEMAENGELQAILDPLFNTLSEEINVLKGRVDSLSSLPDGSTAGDAELEDIRVDYLGYVHENAGNSVRYQAKNNIHQTDYVIFNQAITADLTLDDFLVQNYKKIVIEIRNKDTKNGYVTLNLINNLETIRTKTNLINQGEVVKFLFDGYFSFNKIGFVNTNSLNNVYISIGYFKEETLTNLINNNFENNYKLDNIILNKLDNKALASSGYINSNTNYDVYEFYCSKNQKIIYTNTSNFTAYPTLFGYKNDGTAIPLVNSGNQYNKIIEIPVDIILIRFFYPSNENPIIKSFYDNETSLIDMSGKNLPQCDSINNLSVLQARNISYQKTNNISINKNSQSSSGYINLDCENINILANDTIYLRTSITPTTDLKLRIGIFSVNTEMYHTFYNLKANNTYEIYQSSKKFINASDTSKIQFQLYGNSESSFIINSIYVSKSMQDLYNDLHSYYTLKNFDKNIFTVDSNGYGDFITLDQAVNFVKSNFDVINKDYTIFVKNGEYLLEPTNTYPYVCIDKGSNRISIIGESCENVKLILYNTSTVQSRILNIGGPCIIKNISFYVYADGYTLENDLGHNPYCIHNDTSFDSDTLYETVIENCYLYSECHSPIGAGLSQNQHQIYKNCKFISNGVKSNGAFYVHSPASTTANKCEITLENSTCQALDNTPAISMNNAANTGIQYKNIPCTFQRNIISSNGTVINNDFKTTHKITEISSLNNNDLLNY